MPAEQELLKKIKQLDERQRAEVIDFVDFLMAQRASGDVLLDTMQDEANPTVSIEEVRRRLSTIKGSMADTVSNLRDDRV